MQLGLQYGEREICCIFPTSTFCRVQQFQVYLCNGMVLIYLSEGWSIYSKGSFNIGIIIMNKNSLHGGVGPKTALLVYLCQWDKGLKRTGDI